MNKVNNRNAINNISYSGMKTKKNKYIINGILKFFLFKLIFPSYLSYTFKFF